MTRTAKELLDWAHAKLSPIFDEGAARDARVLLAHVMDVDRGLLGAKASDIVSPDQIARFKAAIGQRVKRQPVSQIIGSREFWGRTFLVTRDVLDPRPDTETLIEEVLKAKAAAKILDLGTGSGCILLTLLAEWPNSKGLGIDRSKSALAVAQTNAGTLELENRVGFIQSDWFSNVTGKFDLIVSNPPYITAKAMQEIAPEVRDWEPRIALTPEGDGLDAYREIADKAAGFLTAHGQIFMETGWDQAEAVLDIFTKAGFQQGRCIKDIAGNDRVLSFQAPEKV